MQLLAGFRIEEFAGGFRRPRFMTLGPGGEILATDSMPSPGGGIYVIGATERKPIISNLDKPYGLAFWGNYLYVAEPESIKRYQYDAKSLRVGPGQEILSLKGLGAIPASTR